MLSLRHIKNLNVEDVFMLINETTDLYNTIKKHNGYFTLHGSYMFEFPVQGQYCFAEIQKLWNSRITKQNQSKDK